MQSLRWDERDYIDWLRSSFERLEAEAGTPNEHLAFYPLRLNLELSARGQLFGVFQTLRGRHPRLAEALRHAIETQIREWDQVGLDTDELALAIEFWRSLPPLCPPGDLVAQVRLFLRALGKHDLPNTEELVRVLVQAVSTTPVNQMHLSFFEELFDGGEYWQDEFMRLLVDRYLSWREDDLSGAWFELRMQFSQALERAASPTEPGGRAFISNLARRLLPEEPKATVPTSVEQWGNIWERLTSSEFELEEADTVYVVFPPAKSVAEFPKLAQLLS